MDVQKINQIVAKKVMKYEGYSERKGMYRDIENNEIVFFEPATKIEDAWKVVEMYRKKGVYLVVQPYKDCYEVDWLDENLNPRNTKAQTAPLALCLASLKMIEETLSE